MIVIFGGTGTLGHALTKILVERDQKFLIVSRCENRQRAMQKLYPQGEYVLGDVSTESFRDKLRGIVPSVVFNLAAMKHVDLGESNVSVCHAINYQGVVNTYNWALENNAVSYAFTSTDKAILPVNAYGAAKMLAVKFLLEKVGKVPMVISTFIWGNVAYSRGSFLENIEKAISSNKPVEITDKRMTRFWITIEDVAKFMWSKALFNSEHEPHIPPMKAASLLRIVEMISRGRPYEIKEIGIRPGEKIHEVLRTGHDYCISSDKCEQYSDDELKKLLGIT